MLDMGLHPRLGGIVYGFGLFLNGLFWLAAAAMAYYAIRLGNVPVRRTEMVLKLWQVGYVRSSAADAEIRGWQGL